MRTCARIIAAMFAVCFVLSTLLALALWNVNAFLLDADAYKQSLSAAHVYDRLPGLLGEQIQFSMTYNPCAEDPTTCEGDAAMAGEPSDDGGPPSYFRELDAREWEVFLQVLFPSNWVEEQAESVLDQAFDSLSASNPQPVSLSLVGLKAYLLGPAGDRAARVLIEAQPRCTEAQLSELAQATHQEGQMDALLSCRPPDEVLEANVTAIRAQFHELVRGWPDTTDLTFGFLRGEPASEGQIQASEGFGLLDALRLLRRAAHLSPLAPILCLLLITLFAVRSKVEACRWWGIPLVFAGLLAAAGAAAANPLLHWGADHLLLPRAPQSISPNLIRLALDLVFEVSGGLATRVLIQSLVLALAGIGLLVLARLRRPKPTEPAPA